MKYFSLDFLSKKKNQHYRHTSSNVTVELSNCLVLPRIKSHRIVNCIENDNNSEFIEQNLILIAKMPSLNNEHESDGDDDMSGNESQHSNSSRDPKADSSEADEPDSDSSELDEQECERRTAGFVKYMGKQSVLTNHNP